MNNPFDPKFIQEEKAEREARRLKLRTNLLIALFCAVLGGFAAVLYQVQVVDGASYLTRTNYNVIETQRVDSVRGEILDRYGRVLVTNEISYNVALDAAAMGDARNAALSRLLEICREEGVDWADSLPISKTAPWTYTTDTPLSYGTDDGEGEVKAVPTSLGLLAQKSGWVKDAAAAQPSPGKLLEAMCQSFGIIGQAPPPRLERPELAGALAAAGQSLGLEDEGAGVTQADRELAGVLYELSLRGAGITYADYLFARGVGIAFISRVKENALPGVGIETAAARRYETLYAPHVLGYTGPIPAERAEHYRELGYPGNATVGIAGVELAFEENLHGASGDRLIEKDQNGNIISQEWRTAPGPGDNAVLTLDIALQAAAEDLLAQYAAAQEKVGPMAAAVVDMTGGVLALASYPSYDLATFRENWAALEGDESQPMLNRATMGLYAPGSTFKMVTAVAGLSEGVITPRDTVPCTGIYRHWASVGHSPHCWIFDSVGGSHGSDNVTKAITDSCNIFFYDVGRRVGISALARYAASFGLGQYTGIEIPEYKGAVAGPETSRQRGQSWQGGNITSAAIGQENNQFTPLQLANYVATLVNGGNHYQCHLLKQFKSSDYSRVTREYQPVLLDSIDIREGDLDAVLRGMYNLAKTPGMARYFSSLPVEVGCKTGTAQVAAKTANAVFVCFAPYDDPQVALCLVAEQGASGGSLAELAAGILAQYFSAGSSLSAVPGENALLR